MSTYDILTYRLNSAAEVSVANAIWLRNWRWALERARATGGRVIQIIVSPGLSEMQVAEADMAADRGTACAG